MSHALSPVIPRNITRAKRIAKQLLAFYPACQLSTCQATTAHLFGFKDWHALEEVCKSPDAKSPGPFDEQLDDAAFTQRRTVQMWIICSELGGIDPQADHGRPLGPSSKSSLTEAELQAQFAARNAQIDLRLEKAGARWSVVFATNVIDEIQATAENASEAVQYIDFLTRYEAEQLQLLPALLGQWWSVNVPHQPEVGAALKAFKLNPHHSTSLLKFGFYWGSLCVYYARTINWTMAMGVAYLLAERYGSIFVQQQEEFCKLLQGEGELTEDIFAVAKPAFEIYAAVAHHEFFECYPRDDFADAFSKQPMAFAANAEETMKILSTPGSQRGTWADNN